MTEDCHSARMEIVNRHDATLRWSCARLRQTKQPERNSTERIARKS